MHTDVNNQCWNLEPIECLIFEFMQPTSGEKQLLREDDCYYLWSLFVWLTNVKRIIVWQRNWPDVRTAYCLSVRACVAVLSGMANGYAYRDQAIINGRPLKNVFQFPLLFAHNQYFHPFIFAIIVPLCQTSCPLRTVHLHLKWYVKHAKYPIYRPKPYPTPLIGGSKCLKHQPLFILTGYATFSL